MAARGLGGNIYCLVFKAKMEKKDGLSNNVMKKKDSDGSFSINTHEKEAMSCVSSERIKRTESKLYHSVLLGLCKAVSN